MPGCCAYGCSNRSENGFILKVFPKDKVRRALWASKVKRDKWKPTNNSYLCESHFDESQWEKVRVDGKKKLKFSAVPTIFTHQPIKPIRKTPVKRLQNSTPSPIKRAKSNITEYSYATSQQQSEPSYDKPPSIDNTHATSQQHLEPSYDNPPSIDNTYTDINIIPDDTLEKADILKQIEYLKKKISKQGQLVHKLLQNNNHTLKMNYKQNIKYATFTKTLKSFLNDNQIASLSVKNKKGFKWSNASIKTALRLKFVCGSNGYEELLAQNNPLPSLRTIRRKLQKISFSSGILECI
ncbi:unnamed protein product [Macrosiphum euphorbiae]|uniref:THAP-type domain-containing protein n=1 Tax=Macrosiphum euphorbiae TaxID=13131 RepID=A0AAV0WU38_9HEMI|nr:unnamed protein product [Macrosiphum euphorbiae]